MYEVAEIVACLDETPDVEEQLLKAFGKPKK